MCQIVSSLFNLYYVNNVKILKFNFYEIITKFFNLTIKCKINILI